MRRREPVLFPATYDPAEFLPDELREPDEEDVVDPQVRWGDEDAPPWKPPKPKKAPQVKPWVPAPLVKFCTQCGTAKEYAGERRGEWAKRRRCEECRAKGHRKDDMRHCMTCGQLFSVAGRLNANHAVCHVHRRQS